MKLRPVSTLSCVLRRTAITSLSALISCLCITTVSAHAQDSSAVVFSVNQTTSVGQSVYVLGDLPELGANDVSRAVKLEPTAYPIWRATIEVPTNRNYTFRYLIRSDAPAQQRVITNGTFVTPLTNGFVPGVPVLPQTKFIQLHTTISSPILNWRHAGETVFQQTALLPFGEGRTPAEQRWAAPNIGQSQRTIEFYITSAATSSTREPSSGTYSTPLDTFLLQDGNVYSYSPASSVGAQRRDYNPSSPPFIASTNLSGETRRYRVLLPRGYDQHTNKRYPVIYMHDGQNIFETGPFGTWAADVAAALQTRIGAMRECIIVGIDNTSNRFADYTTPADGGRGDRYTNFIRNELKPIIDAQYRTLPDALNTGAIGSSLGAVISLYMGWDYTNTFTRLGLLSGAWQATGIDTRAANETKRPVRMWLDSGDSGTSNDNYWLTFNLRDALIQPNHAGGAYTIQNDVVHMVGFNHSHNEAAWSQRIGPAFAFLFPGREEPSPFLALASGDIFDLDENATLSIDDLYLQHVTTTQRDINASGTVTPGDAAALQSMIRRHERAGMVNGRS